MPLHLACLCRFASQERNELSSLDEDFGLVVWLLSCDEAEGTVHGMIVRVINLDNPQRCEQATRLLVFHDIVHSNDFCLSGPATTLSPQYDALPSTDVLSSGSLSMLGAATHA